MRFLALRKILNSSINRNSSSAIIFLKSFINILILYVVILLANSPDVVSDLKLLQKNVSPPVVFAKVIVEMIKNVILVSKAGGTICQD